MGKIIHEQLSGAIIGIAMEVLNELNPGLDEKLYERAMIIEMRRRGLLRVSVVLVQANSDSSDRSYRACATKPAIRARRRDGAPAADNS